MINMITIMKAVKKLEAGKLIVFPTETVYGLGCDAENAVAVSNIYTIKKRPINHPIIVHIASGANIDFWATDIPPQAYTLITAFWPGPLTLILKRAAHAPTTISGGQNSIGLRCSSHPITQALLRIFKDGKGGIAGPSANKFNYISATTVQHIRDEFFKSNKNNLISYILDGGQSEIGIESTILDLSHITSNGIILARPGKISIHQISSVLGITPQKLNFKNKLRISGTLQSHYAPHTPTIQVPLKQLQHVLKSLSMHAYKFGLIQRLANLPLSNNIKTLPITAEQYGHDLYATLRTLDTLKVDVIIIESLPKTLEWHSINDRLKRATFRSTNTLSYLLKT